MNENPNWILHGSYFETCNCEVSCPCIWLQPPSHGDCRLLAAWHIERGHLEGLPLDGLNAALACYAPGLMIDGQWQAALYVDERADDAQFDALVQIFGGRKGGHPAVLMSLVGEVLGIRKVGIDFQAQGKSRRLVIPGIAEAEIAGIQGISGAESTIDNPPLCVVTSHPSVVARSNSHHYRDHGKEWEFSERNGYYSEFVYRP